MSKKKKKKSIAELASEAIHKQLELKGIDVLAVVGITVKEMKTRNCFGGIDKDGITIYEFTPKDELIKIDSFDWNNYESVSIDHFAMKSVFVFKSEGLEREIVINDGNGKDVENVLRQNTNLKVNLVERKWFNKIIGFRSKTKWKMILASFIYLAIFAAIVGAFSDDKTEKAEELEIEEVAATQVDGVDDKNDDDKKKKDKKAAKPDMNLEIEVIETIIKDDVVTVKGTTNIIDGAILDYQLRATMDEVEVENGKWEVSVPVEKLDKDDENNIYSDGSEYSFLIIFPSFGSTANQPDHVQETYGEYGENIKKGPNLLESNGSKYISFEIDFDKDGIIDPEERKGKDYQNAIKEWEDSFKQQMMDHYSEAGIISIAENPGGDFDVFNVFVPNVFKLYSDEEKIYYVEEIGPLLEADLTSHFKKEHDVHVYFLYEDGSTMASRKMFGGWKLKK